MRHIRQTTAIFPVRQRPDQISGEESCTTNNALLRREILVDEAFIDSLSQSPSLTS